MVLTSLTEDLVPLLDTNSTVSFINLTSVNVLGRLLQWTLILVYLNLINGFTCVFVVTDCLTKDMSFNSLSQMFLLSLILFPAFLNNPIFHFYFLMIFSPVEGLNSLFKYLDRCL